MASFTYSAMNEQGRRIRGEMTAANEVDLEERLKQIGLDLVTARTVKERRGSRYGSVRLRDMILLCLHLEQLDRAGVPLLEALADVRDATESPRLKDVLTDVYEGVKGGKVLSQALAEHPKLFNEVFTGLIAAGEKTGNLSESFKNLSNHMKWTNDIRRKVKKALMYPILLLVVMVGVIITLMLVLVPKLVEFMLAQGFELPMHTRALIATSNFVGDYWYIIIGAPFVITSIITACYFASESFAYRMDQTILRLPIIGKTAQKINLARFAHFFAIMFRSGIPILEALNASERVVGNLVIRDAVATARRSVATGNSLTNSLRLSSQFPNLVIRMFKVGEDSGNMNEALENVSFFYDQEVNDAVDNMVAMIQPMLTVVLGMIILWVVAAMFGPLYESFSKMKF